jgi:hypothetical protein
MPREIPGGGKMGKVGGVGELLHTPLPTQRAPYDVGTFSCLTAALEKAPRRLSVGLKGLEGVPEPKRELEALYGHSGPHNGLSPQGRSGSTSILCHRCP